MSEGGVEEPYSSWRNYIFMRFKLSLGFRYENTLCHDELQKWKSRLNAVIKVWPWSVHCQLDCLERCLVSKTCFSKCDRTRRCGLGDDNFVSGPGFPAAMRQTGLFFHTSAVMFLPGARWSGLKALKLQVKENISFKFAAFQYFCLSHGKLTSTNLYPIILKSFQKEKRYTWQGIPATTET